MTRSPSSLCGHRSPTRSPSTTRRPASIHRFAPSETTTTPYTPIDISRCRSQAATNHDRNLPICSHFHPTPPAGLEPATRGLEGRRSMHCLRAIPDRCDWDATRISSNLAPDRVEAASERVPVAALDLQAVPGDVGQVGLVQPGGSQVRDPAMPEVVRGAVDAGGRLRRPPDIAVEVVPRSAGGGRPPARRPRRAHARAAREPKPIAGQRAPGD